MRAQVERDGFLLIDGDVVFDPAVVEGLLDRGPDCLAVRSVGDIGLEEVKVTADPLDRVLAIGKHVPVRSAMGESVGIELFSAATSRRLFAALHHRMHEQGLVNEYYEAAFPAGDRRGSTLYGVDIGTMYATRSTPTTTCSRRPPLAQRPAFDLHVHGPAPRGLIWPGPRAWAKSHCPASAFRRRWSDVGPAARFFLGS